jgi:hypothetical protein
MKLRSQETGLWNNNSNKIFWRLFKRSTIKRDYKYEMEFRLIPERSRDICVRHFKDVSVRQRNLRSGWHRLLWWLPWSRVGDSIRYPVMVRS